MNINFVIKGTKDMSEAYIEVFDADNNSNGSGLPVELRIELKERGYIDTGSPVTGLRLTIPANPDGKSKVINEYNWLTGKNIKSSQNIITK
jgi:hypothetical protein